MPHLRALSIIALAAAAACGSSSPSAQQPAADSSSGNEQPVMAAGTSAPEPSRAAGAENAKAHAASGTERPASQSSSSEPAPRSQFDTPLQDCQVESDYNQCVVDRLDGRTRSEEELMAVIQSHRMLDNVEDAKRNIQKFLDRYPDSPMVSTYRQYLDTH